MKSVVELSIRIIREIQARNELAADKSEKESIGNIFTMMCPGWDEKKDFHHKESPEYRRLCSFFQHAS